MVVVFKLIFSLTFSITKLYDELIHHVYATSMVLVKLRLANLSDISCMGY